MPLPTPKSNEKQTEFINRCMDSDLMQKEYGNDKQRLAVCHTQYRRMKQKRIDASMEDIEPTFDEFENEVNDLGVILS